MYIYSYIYTVIYLYNCIMELYHRKQSEWKSNNLKPGVMMGFLTYRSPKTDKKIRILVGGIPTPLKNMKVSWDDDIPIYGKIKHVPKHQPVYKYIMKYIQPNMNNSQQQ